MCGGGVKPSRSATAAKVPAIAVTPTTANDNTPPPSPVVKRTMTRKQVLDESDPDTNCLIIIGDSVYNCTKWMAYHPGGHLTIRGLSGKDATDSFFVNHPKFVHENLVKKSSHLLYARLTTEDAQQLDEPTKDFRDLTSQMEEMGLFDTEYTFYYWMIARIACMFALVLCGVFLSDSVCVHALSGMLLGMFWQQIAFVGHDIGHNGITHDRITDSRLGIVFGSFLTGISVAWWKRNHNVHHVVTNSIEHDPDIQHMPFFAVHKGFLEKGGVFSSFYKQYQPLNNIAHFMISIQHLSYFPIMAFARFYLYVQSVMHALGVGPYDLKEPVYRRDLQIMALIGFWSWLLGLAFSLPTWTSRVLFVVLAHNVGGMLHVQITLSHFGMPSYCGHPYVENKQVGEYLKVQLEGTLDIECSPKMDWFHGGLQFQAVHHLWPRLPRRNLRKAQALLISFCDKHNLTYCRVDFGTAVKMTIAKLKETSRCAKSFDKLIYEGITLSG